MLGTTEGPSLWSGLWIQVLQELILPLVASLANQAANAGAREGRIVHALQHIQGIRAQWPSGLGPGVLILFRPPAVQARGRVFLH